MHVKPSRVGELDRQTGLLHCSGWVRLSEVAAVSGRTTNTVERHLGLMGVRPEQRPELAGFGRRIRLADARTYLARFSEQERVRS